MADTQTISSTEFQTRAGQYLERGSRVIVTRYNRPLKVLVDYDEFEHLKDLARHRPTRVAFRAEEMGSEIAEALAAADFSHIDPDLNTLME